jgi:hypothetical protein
MGTVMFPEFPLFKDCFALAVRAMKQTFFLLCFKRYAS